MSVQRLRESVGIYYVPFWGGVTHHDGRARKHRNFMLTACGLHRPSLYFHGVDITTGCANLYEISKSQANKECQLLSFGVDNQGVAAESYG